MHASYIQEVNSAGQQGQLTTTVFGCPGFLEASLLSGRLKNQSQKAFFLMMRRQRDAAKVRPGFQAFRNKRQRRRNHRWRRCSVFGRGDGA